ncbi:glycosyltransferase family 4 protein [Mucilaginibacter sp. HMF5004]|uniref:glycosyltransferase family 4 protein n=1 Tax=Mucilaginibacter rivuli TaxID=2857527 RepID=UPI001C5FE6ED|nr:glycosyltransferase family 4 protein [Mucilaginibacter rivuli]MBW4890162.1 glycosyltransferase family 4 protein [Mucilaginibacter rivuli]
MQQPKVLYLTNIPVPYREKMHEILASKHGIITYRVVYCAKTEPNRQWKLKEGNYDKVYMEEEATSLIHNNRSVIKHLAGYKPDVVISTGFNPTMLYAFVWCIFKGKKFIPFNDGTLFSESTFSVIHKLVRTIVFRFSAAFITTGIGGVDLYESYGISKDRIFISHLCVENSLYKLSDPPPKQYDLMFSGQLIDRKMPFFFIDVAKQVKQKLGTCKVLILGDGPLRNEVLAKLEEDKIDYDYPGFVQPDTIPVFYNRSKIFLFPTQSDPWGIVANEACASGVPVITCKNSGAADDLIINGYNGYVLPLETEIWANAALQLLTDEKLLQQFSVNAVISVQQYNPANAAKGIEDAVANSLI